jgi:hypothetical protein
VNAIDTARSNAQTAEAAFLADQTNVAGILAAAANASAPLPAAQAQLTTDQALYVAALQAESDQALAEIATLNAPPAAPAAPAS